MIADGLDQAVAALKAGQIVAFPTETVYGLAADALDESRVRRIFDIKARPATNPLIVHVADVAMARSLAANWPHEADRIAETFWPGPVTIVIERSDIVPDIVTAGGPTVGVRCPDHDLARALIRGCGSPLVGPSANRSGHVSPTTAQHVEAEFGDNVLVLDGGPCRAGIESTVVSLASRPFRVLRPGVIGAPALSRAIGEPVEEAAETVVTGGAAPSPGLHARHYAPRTRCILVDRIDEAGPGRICAIVRGPAPSGIPDVIVMPENAADYARALYDALRRADDSGADLIAIERPPLEGRQAEETAIWASIADRLSRATTASYG